MFFRNSIDLLVANMGKIVSSLENGEYEKELTEEQFKV